MRPTRTMLVAGLASAATALTPAAALAAPHASHHGTPKMSRHHSTGARHARSAGALASQYAVFARPQQPSDLAPAVASLANLSSHNPHGPGADASSSRRVGDGPPIYLLPARNGLCAVLLIPNGHASAMGCTDPAHQGFLSAATWTPAGWTVWGAAANGTQAVTVTLADGHTATLPVHNNGFSGDFATQPTSIQAA